MVGDVNLVAASILKGISIFGVTGAAKRVDVRSVTTSASQASFMDSGGYSKNYYYIKCTIVLLQEI